MRSFASSPRGQGKRNTKRQQSRKGWRGTPTAMSRDNRADYDALKLDSGRETKLVSQGRYNLTRSVISVASSSLLLLYSVSFATIRQTGPTRSSKLFKSLGRLYTLDRRKRKTLFNYQLRSVSQRSHWSFAETKFNGRCIPCRWRVPACASRKIDCSRTYASLNVRFLHRIANEKRANAIAEEGCKKHLIRKVKDKYTSYMCDYRTASAT